MCRSIGNVHHLKQRLLAEINECCMFALCYSWKVLCIKITSYTKRNYDTILKIFSFFTLDDQAAAHLSFWQAATVKSPAKTREFIKKNTFFTRMSLPPVKAQNKDSRIKGHMKRKSWGIGSDKWETQRRSITKGVHVVNISKTDSKISQDSSSSTNEMAELMRGKAKESTKNSSHAFCICGNNIETTRKLFAVSICFENVSQILLQKQFHNNDFSHGGDKAKLNGKFNTENISLVLFQLASLLSGCLFFFFNLFLFFSL